MVHTRSLQTKASKDKVSLGLSSVSMKKPHILKKHVKNAKELDKKRRMETIVRTINDWLVPGNTVAPEMLEQTIACIKQLSLLMGFHFDKQLLVATMIYIEKFVQRHGPIQFADVFDLFVVASTVTMKFWAEEQYRVDMDLTSYVSGIPKKAISSMERVFLGTIEYSLFLDSNAVENWQLQHSILDQTSDSNFLTHSPPTSD